MWGILKEYLLSFLTFLADLTGSWGIAIIILTILVKLALHPLTKKQNESMQKMQKLQPRMKVLQEKYQYDKETLNKEMMNLYQQYQINPLAGCLPLLVQLPILILLFQVLREAAMTLSGVTFLGIPLENSVLAAIGKAVGAVATNSTAEGITMGFTDVLKGIGANPAGLANIGIYGPSLFLVIAVIFMTWYQTTLSSTGNEQMATMSIVMPIMMGVICLTMPGGLILYWGLSTFISVAQQWRLKKKTQVELSQKPTLYKEKPRQ